MNINWPIGTPEERAAANEKIPGYWINSNPFGNWYQIAPRVWNYHDGVDLNLNMPSWNADFHKPIYSIADGVVSYAGLGGGSWGNIVVIEHTDDSGKLFYSRCGHVEKMIVKTGDVLTIGQQIAQVGDANGYFKGVGAHLHFNICITSLLKTKPNHWSGADKNTLLAHYIDPVKFIADQGTTETPPPDPNPVETLYVRASGGLRLRNQPRLTGVQIALLPTGSKVNATETYTADGYTWRKIAAPQGNGWAAQATIDGRTILLSHS
jgi:murein DD-endopeptidase MepM/ murein hydrolase activator NlpD